MYILPFKEARETIDEYIKIYNTSPIAPESVNNRSYDTTKALLEIA